MKRNVHEHNKLKIIVFERDNYQCVSCGEILKKGNFNYYGGMRTNLIVDHIIPISRNGTNSLENMRTLCLECARKKDNEDKHLIALWRKNKV